MVKVLGASVRSPDRLAARSGFHSGGITIRGYGEILQNKVSMFSAHPQQKVIIEFTDPNPRDPPKGTVIRDPIG